MCHITLSNDEYALMWTSRWLRRAQQTKEDAYSLMMDAFCIIYSSVWEVLPPCSSPDSVAAHLDRPH